MKQGLKQDAVAGKHLRQAKAKQTAKQMPKQTAKQCRAKVNPVPVPVLRPRSESRPRSPLQQQPRARRLCQGAVGPRNHLNGQVQADQWRDVAEEAGQSCSRRLQQKRRVRLRVCRR